jgi:hypothetical protein
MRGFARKPSIAAGLLPATERLSAFTFGGVTQGGSFPPEGSQVHPIIEDKMVASGHFTRAVARNILILEARQKQAEQTAGTNGDGVTPPEAGPEPPTGYAPEPEPDQYTEGSS